MWNLEYQKVVSELGENAAICYCSQTVSQKEYASRLFSRIDDAESLRAVEVSIGDWRPVANKCHGNATSLGRHDSRFSPARGWLYFDFLGALEYVLFLAHSVVRVPNGELWDITPMQASQDYLFLPAIESEEKYAALIESGVVRLWHRK